MPKMPAARSARARESHQGCAPRQRPALIELIITAALALSTVVAVTAVSLGIARAEVAGAVAKGDGLPLAIALSIALLLTAIAGSPPLRPPRRGGTDHRFRRPVGGGGSHCRASATRGSVCYGSVTPA
jgi:hypothetical protein